MKDICKNSRLRPLIRVFISSTFSDMRSERNAMQEYVYPKLEQFCLMNGFQFQAIDLRWGISNEASLDHRTMRICLEELRRSQEVSPEPNFLILLGNRYGWRPLPEEMSQSEFEKLVKASISEGENHPLIKGIYGKTAHKVLCEWYRCDENMQVPINDDFKTDSVLLNYILQPRTHNLDEDWSDVQRILWNIINVAFPAESLNNLFNNPQIVRFQASATEQEIWSGALSAEHAEQHVLAFFRDIENIDDYPLAEVKDYIDCTESGNIDLVAAARQVALKEELRKRLGKDAVANIPFSRLKKNENGKVIVDISNEDRQKFCDSVETRLKSIIERQIKQYWKNTKHVSLERAGRELEIEQQEHFRVCKERGGSETFIGRKGELQEINNYLLNKNSWPLVVCGSSGCGKTALLSRATLEAEELKPIVRLIGIHPRASNLLGLLSSLCQELRLRYPLKGELPTEIKKLELELNEQLKAVKQDQPLILFLDSLDQLSDSEGGRLLHWLPAGPLPNNVKIVLSCLSDRAIGDLAGQPYEELIRRQLPVDNFISLKSFSEEEARTLLFERWLPRVERTVNEDQRISILKSLASSSCRQPIYLKLLFEEAKLWRSYNSTVACGEDVFALLDQLFERLSLSTNHGKILVEKVLDYLSVSKEGLSENEILEILFEDPEYKIELARITKNNRDEIPPNASRIPIAIWSRLRFDLDPYISERAGSGANVLTFYHRQVAEWVDHHLEKSSNRRLSSHDLLAKYFFNKADPKNNRTWVGDGRRAFEQLPFHLKGAHRFKELYEILSELAYLDARVLLSGPVLLLSEYEKDFIESNSNLKIWHSFILSHSSNLRLSPALLPSLAWYEGPPEIRISAEHYLNLNEHRHTWLKLDLLPPVQLPVQTDEEKNLKTPNFEILASCDEIKTNVAAIASGCGIGFYLKTIGHIGIINFETGIDSIYDIQYSLKNRLLTMAASADGRWLAIVDDLGNGLCLELEWMEDEILQPLVVSIKQFTCFLPEVDNPVVLFADNYLWWQDESGNISSWKLGSTDVCKLAKLNGVLRSMFGINNDIAVLDVTLEKTIVKIISQSEQIREIPFNQSNIQMMCPNPGRGLFCLTQKGETIALQQPYYDKFEYGPVVSGLVNSINPINNGILFDLSDRTDFWTGSTNDPIVSFQNLKFGSGSILACAAEGDILYIIKSRTAFRAKLMNSVTSPSIKSLGYRIASLCPDYSEKSYYALVENNRSLFAVGPVPQQAYEYGKATTDNAKAISNRGLLAWKGSTGQLFLWSPPEIPGMLKLKGVGQIMNITAGKKGEFWLTNENNEIWWVNTEGKGNKICSVQNIMRPTPHRLIVCDEWLIWCGTSMGDLTHPSADHVDTVVFFKISVGFDVRGLQLMGHHYFAPENGRWTLSLWDERKGELACFFQNIGQRRFLVRVGSPQEMLLGKEKVVDLDLPEKLVTDLVSGTSFAKGRGWLVRTFGGWLVALESDTFNMLGSYPVGVHGGIATQSGSNGKCLVIVDGTEVVHCELSD